VDRTCWAKLNGLDEKKIRNFAFLLLGIELVVSDPTIDGSMAGVRGGHRPKDGDGGRS
jgi:hypothetical protein